MKFERVCARDGRPVAWADLVKGYEYSKGQFVVLTKEDFRAAALEKTHRVEIMDFVKAADIDDRFFETPYYVVPAKAGTHAYALLRAAMQAAGRIGIAKVMLRDIQHLAALEVIDDTLVLTLLRFADELADASQLPIPAAKDVAKAELDMAKALVQSLAAEWEPGKYKDEYRDNLKRVIQAKAKGRHVKLPSTDTRHPAEVVDLMERLRRSLAEKAPSRKTGRATRKGRRRRAA